MSLCREIENNTALSFTCKLEWAPWTWPCLPFLCVSYKPCNVISADHWKMEIVILTLHMTCDPLSKDVPLWKVTEEELKLGFWTSSPTTSSTKDWIASSSVAIPGFYPWLAVLSYFCDLAPILPSFPIFYSIFIICERGSDDWRVLKSRKDHHAVL